MEGVGWGAGGRGFRRGHDDPSHPPSVRSVRHLEALWFANVCNSIMWWTYMKAAWRALVSAVGMHGITFKTTLKGASAVVSGAVRDLWLPGVCFVGLFSSAIAGAIKLFTGPTVQSPLAISVLWALYGAIPPFLALYYSIISRGAGLQGGMEDRWWVGVTLAGRRLAAWHRPNHPRSHRSCRSCAV